MTSRGHQREHPCALTHERRRAGDPDTAARVLAAVGEFGSERPIRLNRDNTKTVGTAELVLVPAGRGADR